jgi:Tfp pilus assembly protein PilF
MLLRIGFRCGTTKFTAEAQRALRLRRGILESLRCLCVLCASAVKNFSGSNKFIIAAFFVLLSFFISATAQTHATGSLKVTTGQAGSVIFINNVRHGVTNEAGVAEIKRVWAGAFPVRVRTAGFMDWTGRVVIAANATKSLNVKQQPTSDEALLHFQRGDALRDKGQNADAIKEYQQALALRASFPEARIAYTRSLITTQDFQEAEKQLALAQKNAARPLAEVHTVTGNLRRHQGLTDEAIAEYRKALKIAAGNSFEAHIGLGIVLNEQEKYDEAVKEYRIGINQDMETEPVLYYQLGEILEKAKRNKEAIAAYQRYIALDPEGEFVSAAESVIEQLKDAKQ